MKVLLQNKVKDLSDFVSVLVWNALNSLQYPFEVNGEMGIYKFKGNQKKIKDIPDSQNETGDWGGLEVERKTAQ